MDFPDYIINEVGDKLIPNTGNVLFLSSCIYTASHYPVRLLIDEGHEEFTCAFVIYITATHFVCVDTSSVGKNFQGIFKIPIDSYPQKCYNKCSYRIYVTETLTQ